MKKKAKSQSNLSRALASSNNTRVVQQNLFRMLSAGELRRSVCVLKGHRHFRMAISSEIGGFRNLYAEKLPPLHLDKLVAWCLGVLEANREKLQFFLDREVQILEKILTSDYGGAQAEIEEVVQQLGPSTWEIAVNGAIFTMMGAEPKQAYLERTIRKCESNKFLASIAQNLLMRFEDSETLESESKFFEQKIKRSFEGPLLHYLMYKLLPHRFDVDYDFESILNYEKDAGVLDIYLAVVDYVIYEGSRKRIGSDEIASKILRDLRSMFRSETLEALSVSFGLSEPTEISSEKLVVIDKYTAGEYSDVCQLMLSRPDFWRHFALVEIWAKANSRLQEHGECSFSLLISISDIIKKGENFDRSKGFVLASCHALGMFVWFKEMRYLLERETRYYGSDLNNKLKDASLFLADLCTPGKIQIVKGYRDLNDADRLSITKRLFYRMHSASMVEPSDEDLIGVDLVRQIKFKAVWNLRKGLYGRAISLLEQLLEADDPVLSQDASRNLVEAYRSTGQIERAARVYVEAVLANPKLASTFDISGLAKACVPVIASSSSIYIPIVFSFYSNYIDDAHDSALRYSFERFLGNNGISSPLRVFELSGITDRARNYFFSNVCVPEVMKLYLHFESMREVELCRVEICRQLVVRGSADEALLFELKDRARRIVLRQAANQVQGSRIYSDTNFLSGANSAAFKALFDRFSSLRVQDFSESADEKTFRGILDVLKGDERLLESTHIVHVQDLILNEKNRVFLRLIKLMRDEFAFGEKGLNVYLSTRIRHGHLPNSLRKPLRDNFLLATKTSETSAYRVSDDFRREFGMRGQVLSDAETAVIDFSVKFNELVGEVNDKWLRIFTVDPDISGLSQEGERHQSKLNYSVSSLESFYLQLQLKEGATYGDFVAVVNEWLWRRTEASLAHVRELISSDVKSKAIGLLNNLSKAVSGKYTLVELGGMLDAVARAKVGVAQILDILPGWFTRATDTAIAQFDMGVAVEIARRAADVDVDFCDSTNVSWRGEALTSFVDVLYILFENCASKSMLSKEFLVVSAGLTANADSVVLWIENNCCIENSIGDANRQLQRHREMFESPYFSLDSVQQEGGSGFRKIRRIMEKDMMSKFSVSMGFSGSTKFRISFDFQYSTLAHLIHHESTSY